MKRIEELFAGKTSRVLNVYFTAGYPKLDSTIPIMEGIQSGGADLIEIGMPYSDPLADGPVIQESSGVALNNGMSIDYLFHQLSEFRKSIHIPANQEELIHQCQLQQHFDKNAQIHIARQDSCNPSIQLVYELIF